MMWRAINGRTTHRLISKYIDGHPPGRNMNTVVSSFSNRILSDITIRRRTYITLASVNRFNLSTTKTNSNSHPSTERNIPNTGINIHQDNKHARAFSTDDDSELLNSERDSMPFDVLIVGGGPAGNHLSDHSNSF